jgi:hypothetical protein
MDNLFLKNIQERVAGWREQKYPGIERETLSILAHIKRVAYLHQPQIEALETYIYLKEVVGNKATLEVFKSLFSSDKEMLLGLGVSKDEAFDLLDDKERVSELMVERFGASDYPNQVYALTMGSGKTILMATMMLYDFVLSYYHPEDARFAKNALVFAPDTTIIESLKEIRTFDYAKVLPQEYHNVLLNLKYHYLEDVSTALTPIGNYNIIVSNSQKIILKTTKDNRANLFANANYMERREVENKRLHAIRQLNGLAVFVDEAHHSYGITLEGTLKKTRQTINYLHGNKPLTGVINLTGTPYVNNKMIADVVYHFGLKQGIEKGILKQVRFFDYSNVKTEAFLEDVIDKFWSEYGEKRLEQRLPKIAFYAGSIDDVRQDMRPKLERILASRGIPLDKVVEYHTDIESNKEIFFNLDTPESTKQFVLLVGKGTEGWNCRSLVSCALYRKPKSSIFVLQSTTRCLRSIGDNTTVASVFLSNENYRILDRELRNNFAVSIEELSAQDQKTVEHTLKVMKRKKVKVKKVLKEITASQQVKPSEISLSWESFKPEKYTAYLSQGGITISENKARYTGSSNLTEVKSSANYTYYELIELISRYTHLPCKSVQEVLVANGKGRDELVRLTNQTPGIISYITETILSRAYTYTESVQVLEDEVELAKMYPFKINIEQGRNTLVVYQEQVEEDYGSSRLGFHINPYNFDSSDEKNLFRYLRDVLQADEKVVDVYFTGGATDPSHNEFYFEYFSPLKKQVARYFPDFLIETTLGRYLVIEVKSTKEKETYEHNKKTYRGKLEELFDEVYAKEIGFRDFQKANKNFEYRIIFDASLQLRQKEVYDTVLELTASNV